MVMQARASFVEKMQRNAVSAPLVDYYIFNSCKWPWPKEAWCSEYVVHWD